MTTDPTAARREPPRRRPRTGRPGGIKDTAATACSRRSTRSLLIAGHGRDAVPVREHRRPVVQRRGLHQRRPGEPGPARASTSTTYEYVMADALFWTQLPEHRGLHRRRHGDRDGAHHDRSPTRCPRGTSRARTFFIGIAVFTMFFNGGLIPNYVLINALGFTNTIWAIVIPNAISVFNLLVMKAFFENLPDGARGGRRDRRAQHLRHPPADRAAAEQGGHRDDGAVLRGRPSGTRGSPRSSTWTTPSCTR